MTRLYDKSLHRRLRDAATRRNPDALRRAARNRRMRGLRSLPDFRFLAWALVVAASPLFSGRSGSAIWDSATSLLWWVASCNLAGRMRMAFLRRPDYPLALLLAPAGRQDIERVAIRDFRAHVAGIQTLFLLFAGVLATTWSMRERGNGAVVHWGLVPLSAVLLWLHLIFLAGVLAGLWQIVRKILRFLKAGSLLVFLESAVWVLISGLFFVSIFALLSGWDRHFLTAAQGRALPPAALLTWPARPDSLPKLALVVTAVLGILAFPWLRRIVQRCTAAPEASRIFAEGIATWLSSTPRSLAIDSHGEVLPRQDTARHGASAPATALANPMHARQLRRLLEGPPPVEVREPADDPALCRHEIRRCLRYALFSLIAVFVGTVIGNTLSLMLGWVALLAPLLHWLPRDTRFPKFLDPGPHDLPCHWWLPLSPAPAWAAVARSTDRGVAASFAVAILLVPLALGCAHLGTALSASFPWHERRLPSVNSQAALIFCILILTGVIARAVIPAWFARALNPAHLYAAPGLAGLRSSLARAVPTALATLAGACVLAAFAAPVVTFGKSLTEFTGVARFTLWLALSELLRWSAVRTALRHWARGHRP